MGPKALTAQAFLPMPHSLSGRTRLSFQSWPTIRLSLTRLRSPSSCRLLTLELVSTQSSAYYKGSPTCLQFTQQPLLRGPTNPDGFPMQADTPILQGGLLCRQRQDVSSSLTLASITLSEHTGCSHSTRCCFCLQNYSPSLPSWHWAAGS